MQVSFLGSTEANRRVERARVERTTLWNRTHPASVDTRHRKEEETNTSINAERPQLIHAMGALGGAAVGVLINVYAGVPPGGPLVAPTIAAVAGAVAVHWLPVKTLQSPVWRKVGLGVLAVLVGLAAVYVVAAIALSNFE